MRRPSCKLSARKYFVRKVIQVKKTFVEPELEVLRIDVEDILTASSTPGATNPIELPGMP